MPEFRKGVLFELMTGPQEEYLADLLSKAGLSLQEAAKSCGIAYSVEWGTMSKQEAGLLITNLLEREE
jgi:hypothetical protein